MLLAYPAREGFLRAINVAFVRGDAPLNWIVRPGNAPNFTKILIEELRKRRLIDPESTGERVHLSPRLCFRPDDGDVGGLAQFKDRVGRRWNK
jgi:hypothetical protein